MSRTDRSPRRSVAADETTARLATRMAERLCTGFRKHDERDREGALEAFAMVDANQFAHLGREEARAAADAYVDALWAKDAVEFPYIDGRTVVDRAGLERADWERVEAPLRRRAAIVGMDEAYAECTTIAWKRHKVGGDYWTPTLAAQHHEIRAALGVEDYPQKTGFGESGFGHLAARYLVGVELHDMHSDRHWELAIDTMTVYFAELLSLREEL